MNMDLVEAVAKRRCILFAGSGVSATLGVPTWRGLIEYMASELGYDPRVLAPPGVSFLTLAEYFRRVKGKSGIDDLCRKFESEWNADASRLKQSDVLQSIFALSFPIVYTTNYDHNIENAFRLYGGSPAVVRSVAFPIRTSRRSAYC